MERGDARSGSDLQRRSRPRDEGRHLGPQAVREAQADGRIRNDRPGIPRRVEGRLGGRERHQLRRAQARQQTNRPVHGHEGKNHGRAVQAPRQRRRQQQPPQRFLGRLLEAKHPLGVPGHGTNGSGVAVPVGASLPRRPSPQQRPPAGVHRLPDRRVPNKPGGRHRFYRIKRRPAGPRDAPLFPHGRVQAMERLRKGHLCGRIDPGQVRLGQQVPRLGIRRQVQRESEALLPVRDERRGGGGPGNHGRLPGGLPDAAANELPDEIQRGHPDRRSVCPARAGVCTGGWAFVVYDSSHLNGGQRRRRGRNKTIPGQGRRGAPLGGDPRNRRRRLFRHGILGCLRRRNRAGPRHHQVRRVQRLQELQRSDGGGLRRDPRTTRQLFLREGDHARTRRRLRHGQRRNPTTRRRR
mmetsp:Transcript_4490/g.10586  ORF Transcript_4490/g.10586 Transcript_4490/m.10586 type:complete len:409 (-) Transcript_4490:409-1635(-)